MDPGILFDTDDIKITSSESEESLFEKYFYPKCNNAKTFIVVLSFVTLILLLILSGSILRLQTTWTTTVICFMTIVSSIYLSVVALKLPNIRDCLLTSRNTKK